MAVQGRSRIRRATKAPGASGISASYQVPERRRPGKRKAEDEILYAKGGKLGREREPVDRCKWGPQLLLLLVAAESREGVILQRGAVSGAVRRALVCMNDGAENWSDQRETGFKPRCRVPDRLSNQAERRLITDSRQF